MKAARHAWFEGQDDLDPARLFFVDECGTNTKMTRPRGRSSRGERCRASVPHNHWRTTIRVAALTLEGIVTPMIVDEAMSGDLLTAYVKTLLYRELKPGDIVIMDNLPAHKIVTAREAIEATGAQLLFLPAYSPDFNPIEKAINQMKAHLKKVADRIKEGLDNTIATALDLVTPVNAAKSFNACGYNVNTV